MVRPADAPVLAAAAGADAPRAPAPAEDDPPGPDGPARAGWTPSHRWSLGGLVAFVVLAPLVVGGTAWFDSLRLSGIFGIAVVGLSMLSGHAGQISLGQAALVGTGAYGAGIATTRWDLAPPVGAAAAVALAVGVGLLASPVLRLKGNYLALATMATGLLIDKLMVNLASWTGGNNGLSGIPRLSVAGFEIDTPTRSFTLSWTVLVLALVLHVNLGRSRVGRALRAIHHDEDVARAAGIPAARYKIAVWLVAAGLSGLAGALYAYEIRFISPQQFTFGQSVVLLAAVVVGGTGSLFGPVVALVALRTVPVLSPDSEWLTPTMVSGTLMVLVMVFFPGGLAQAWDRTVGAALRRRQGPVVAP
ncbi:MAG: branched-chain amino acid ABC transporter permease [Acidimicrobiia bacterium]